MLIKIFFGHPTTCRVSFWPIQSELCSVRICIFLSETPNMKKTVDIISGISHALATKSCWTCSTWMGTTSQKRRAHMNVYFPSLIFGGKVAIFHGFSNRFPVFCVSRPIVAGCLPSRNAAYTAPAELHDCFRCFSVHSSCSCLNFSSLPPAKRASLERKFLGVVYQREKPASVLPENIDSLIC